MNEVIEQVLAMSPRDRYYKMRELFSQKKYKTVAYISKKMAYDRTKLGEWEKAKKILETMKEPKVPLDASTRKFLNIYVDDILGYKCQYVRYHTSKGIRSWLVLINGDTNNVYQVDFGEVTEEMANDIFNS